MFPPSALEDGGSQIISKYVPISAAWLFKSVQRVLFTAVFWQLNHAKPCNITSDVWVSTDGAKALNNKMKIVSFFIVVIPSQIF
jgi:hypothetical protein